MQKLSKYTIICEITERHNKPIIKFEAINNGEVVMIGLDYLDQANEMLNKMIDNYKIINSDQLNARSELEKQKEIRHQANIRIQELEYELVEALKRKH